MILERKKECDKMYLHICKNVMVKKNDIIGIFKASILDYTKDNKNIIRNIEDVSEGIQKSLILMEKKAYLSNISVLTLEKRAKGGKNGKV